MRKESKISRKNKIKVQRTQAREEVLYNKRLGSAAGPPRIIGIVPLGANATPGKVYSILMQASGCKSFTANRPETVVIPEFKQRFTFIVAGRNTTDILDVAKVSDTLLFVISAIDGVDAQGEHHLRLIKAQGIPGLLTVMQDLPTLSQKDATTAKKQMDNFFAFHFPKYPRVLPFSSEPDVQQTIRFLSTQKVNRVRWRQRPYMLVSNANFIETSPGKGILQVSGYLRGQYGMNVNGLIHIPDFGDFQMTEIQITPDPTPFTKRKKKKSKNAGSQNEMDCDDEKQQERFFSVPSEQESLESEAPVDYMSLEQNLLPEEELELEQEWKVKAPKGTSDYQAAWLVDEDNESDLDDEEQLSFGDAVLAQTTKPDDEKEMADSDDDDSDDDIGLNTAAEVDEEAAQKAREQEYIEFPDEIDTPMNVQARVRFQKYRGLKSFRTSPWDCKENLPIDYAKIFQFKNSDRTFKRVLENHKAHAQPGTYVTISISDVPTATKSYFANGKPFIVSGLFKYEHKLSVIHFSLRRHRAYTNPMEAKEPLLFQCGFRRFVARPLYSDHAPTLDKHRYQKFFQQGSDIVASIYGYISYPPAPVLVFNDNNQFVAHGSLMGVDTDRIVLKRIILSGFPTRVHKRRAVVRLMFHNPEDVRWFSPVEMWTKYGRVGHIIEPLGTHGLMKVRFNTPIQNHDTICMTLYKRVFPAWGTTRYLLQDGVESKQLGS
eukprot:TRINITY_DN235_c0_g2_i1.p1 TRINITY_DN235_c0_g2~~TRINITY_DN235_c0_g2_i1.p1  ORF type:complete len:773 (-),score=131.04 TRINITY_DN235_c0_g2_i1:298-2445(-)